MADKHIGNRQANYVVVSIAPDVCKVGDALVPFDSFQDLSHEKNYVTHVRARGQPILTVGSIIAGTQSNAGKGISSGTSLGNGDCQILTGVSHIKCKGMPIARHGSLVAMNNGNTMGSLYTQLNPPNGRIPVKDTPSWWEKIAEQEAERQKLEIENNQQMAELLEGMGRSFINHQYDFGRELGKGGMLNGSIEFEQQIAVLKAMGADTRIMEEANALNQITVDEIDDSPPLLEMENESQEIGAKLETGLELLLFAKALMSGGVKSIKWLSGRGGSGGVKIVLSHSPIAISNNSARKLLKSRGLNKNIQKDTVSSFFGQIYLVKGKKGDIFTITEHIPGSASQVYVTRGSAGATPAIRRSKLALPPSNSATHERTISLKRDQILLEGEVAPQPQWGEDKTGGGWQVVTAGGKYTDATE